MTQRLGPRVALPLVFGIATLAYVNHEIGLLPDRTLVYLVLCLLPMVWRVVWSAWEQRAAALAGVPSAMPPAGTDPDSRAGIGPARHSKKHRHAR
jgi:hypothetical protein